MKQLFPSNKKRVEAQLKASHFRGGKLQPVMAAPLLPGEAGALRQVINCRLDPIPGELRTPVTAHVQAVYVPNPAIDAHLDPNQDYPGNVDICREKYLAETLFSLEWEGDISRRCGINPRAVNGQLLVSNFVRAAHNVAVNYLRRRVHNKAAQLENTNWDITPALYSTTVLDRMGAVLNPEDRVDGSFGLQLPEVNIPVRGIGVKTTATTPFSNSGEVVYENVDNTSHPDNNGATTSYTYSSELGTDWVIERAGGNGDPRPHIYAAMEGQQVNDFSLRDLYRAERMDGLTRIMRKLVDENPEYGDELVQRFAHGLSMDLGAQPVVVYDREHKFGNSIRPAMDGPSLGKVQTATDVNVEFVLPLPRTELGGVVITFVSVKPDETIQNQPHPIMASDYKAFNHAADSLALDPVPITARDMDSEVAVEDENTVLMYGPNNGLYRSYQSSGFVRDTDPAQFEDEMALWQVDVPLSVTPENVIYPADISHAPFADAQADVVSATVQSVLTVQTPIIYGPSPIEDLAVLDADDVFEDQ